MNEKEKHVFKVTLSFDRGKGTIEPYYMTRVVIEGLGCDNVLPGLTGVNVERLEESD